MPFDPTLDELSSEQQRQMTHQPEQPNPAAPYLEGARKFPSSGLTGAFPALRQAMPGWLNALGDLAQSQAARNVFSTSNVGGIPLIEAMWTPRDLGILKTMYSANIDPYTLAGLIKRYLPGRSIQSIRAKAFQLGLKRPEIPPYVRQPGTPSIANDPARVAQVKELMKKNMTFKQMAMEMGDVTPRTLQRYVNENLRQRLVRRGPNTPSMPSFESAVGPTMGDEEFEKILQDFLKKNPEYR